MAKLSKLQAYFAFFVLGLFGSGAALADSGERGVWWDYSQPEMKSIPSHLQTLKRLRVTRIHIEISAPISEMSFHEACQCPKDGPCPCAAKQYIFGFDQWGKKDLKTYISLPDFIEKLQSIGVSSVLMIWPIPTKQYLTSLERLADFVHKHNVQAIELEAEENWNMRYSIGDFSTLDVASQALFDRIRALMPAITIYVTNGPRDFKPAAFEADKYLFQNADIISYQTYQNVCSEDGFHCSRSKMSGGYQPGLMQERGIKTFESIAGPKTKLVVGLPAYDLATAMQTGQSAMLEGLRSTVCKTIPLGERFAGTNYWSWKNIYKKYRDEGYAKQFLDACDAKRMAKYCNSQGEPDETLMNEVCPGLIDGEVPK